MYGITWPLESTSTLPEVLFDTTENIPLPGGLYALGNVKIEKVMPTDPDFTKPLR